MITVLPLLLLLQGPGAESRAPDAREVFEERQDDLIFLAGKLGGLHRLSQLCEGEGAGVFRIRMQELLELEKPPRDTRAAMIAQFNHNYRQMAELHLFCGNEAIEDMAGEATVALSITDRISGPLRIGLPDDQFDLDR